MKARPPALTEVRISVPPFLSRIQRKTINRSWHTSHLSAKTQTQENQIKAICMDLVLVDDAKCQGDTMEWGRFRPACPCPKGAYNLGRELSYVTQESYAEGSGMRPNYQFQAIGEVGLQDWALETGWVHERVPGPEQAHPADRNWNASWFLGEQVQTFSCTKLRDKEKRGR